MSQHVFSTMNPEGRKVEFIAGWDAQFKAFFAVAEFVDDGARDDITTVLPGVADLFNGGEITRDLDVLTGLAARAGLTVPAQLWDGVQADARERVANRFVAYTSSGAIAMDARLVA